MNCVTDRLAGQPIVIGAGLAGLMTALQLAPQPVVVLTKAPLGAEAATGWAQGGIAAALGPDDNSDLHATDTLACGDGLCDAGVVERVTGAARRAIDDLVRYGVVFDRTADGPRRSRSSKRLRRGGSFCAMEGWRECWPSERMARYCCRAHAS